MRQEALKRHLKEKSFPIPSMKALSPAGEGLRAWNAALSSEHLMFLSYNCTAESCQAWLGEQGLLCCQLQGFPELPGHFPLKGDLLSSPERKSLSFLPFLLPDLLRAPPARGKSLHKSEFFINWNLQMKFFHSLSLQPLLSFKCPSVHLAQPLFPAGPQTFPNIRKSFLPPGNCPTTSSVRPHS